MKRRTWVFLGAAAMASAGGAYLIGSAEYEAAARSLRAARDPASLEGLIHFATLAGSSHNSQPWRFRRTPDGVAIRPDLTRALPVVDGDNHHLYASLGCAAENLMLAAGASGRSAALAYENQGDGSVLVALGGKAVRDPLFDAIPERQCTRSEYDGRGVASQDLAALAAAARLENAEITLIEDRQRMEQVLELVMAGNTAQLSNPDLVAELEAWLRFSSREAISSGDGLSSAASGNPSVPAFIGRFMFRRMFTAQRENDRYARQLRSSAGIAVIHSAGDGAQSWVNAGRSYQRFALAATALGIRHAHLNQPVEVASLRPELQKLLGLGNRRPDMVLRFGRAPAMPFSLRRPVAAVLDG